MGITKSSSLAFKLTAFWLVFYGLSTASKDHCLVESPPLKAASNQLLSATESGLAR